MLQPLYGGHDLYNDIHELWVSQYNILDAFRYDCGFAHTHMMHRWGQTVSPQVREYHYKGPGKGL